MMAEVIRLNDSDDELDMLPAYEEILAWKKDAMVAWLSERDLPRSGRKSQLAQRIFKSLRGDSSSSESESEADAQTIQSAETLESGWEEVASNRETLPQLPEKDIENYFIFHKDPVSGKIANFQRNLCKAKKLSNEHYIGSLFYNMNTMNSQVFFLKSKCSPTMRQNVTLESGKVIQHYTQYVTLSRSSSYVVSAKCDCKAGAAGLCSHVGACLLLFSKLTSPACTSDQCSWTRPSMKAASTPQLWKDIVFMNTEEDISEFMHYFQVDFSFHDALDLQSEYAKEQISDFIKCLRDNITNNVCEKLETATLGQNNNKNWSDARNVLLTSSMFGAVCKRRDSTAPDNLVKQQRGYMSIPDGVKSVAHGRRNEPKARKLYAQHHRTQCQADVTVSETGLHVDPQEPFLGTSVDGIVNCPKCGPGIVEIKCPYGTKTSQWRKMDLKDCCLNSKFYCSINSDGDLQLKSVHNYYYQVMGQLALTKASYCDFVVYTSKGIMIQRLVLDELFWSNMYLKLEIFYKHMVAEIMSGRISRGKSLY